MKDKIIIVGAGISGSSTAIRLCRKGIKPLVIDKVKFPRDTVGEGLSAAVGPYLEELGVLDKIVNSPHTVKKKSIQLVAPSGSKAYTVVDFDKSEYQNRLHHFPYGFNVKRKHFDQVFLDKAREEGAEVRECVTANSFEIKDGNIVGIHITNEMGKKEFIESSLILDCSGRASVLAHQLSLRGPLENVFDGQWANFAIRLHFKNVNMEHLIKNVPDYDPATVNIFPDTDCWYWFIPLDLKEGIISIGFVARYKLKTYIDSSKDKKQAYRDLIANHPILSKVIDGAEMLDDIVATSRLGHMNTQMSGGGFMCIGDAAFFADPAWGTGVTICLRTSQIASEIAEEAVKAQNFSKEFLSKYDRLYKEFIEAPFNSIRAYNYYYNDAEYVEFIIDRLSKNPNNMDMIGAVLFDYASHERFQKWTYNEFKAFIKEKDRYPNLTRVSQFDFDSGKLADQKITAIQ